MAQIMMGWHTIAQKQKQKLYLKIQMLTWVSDRASRKR